MAKKEHTVYKNKAGERVPSVTTILGMKNKPLLVPWANKLGLQGINTRDYVDNLADIGTIAHGLAEEYLTNEVFDLTGYTKEQIETAKISLEKFYDWVKQNNPQDCISELRLVSEVAQYGGTCDLYCKIGDCFVLVDFKTCKAIYPEHCTQTIAYKNLLVEHGYRVDYCIILRIGRSEEEGFEVQRVENEDLHYKMFEACHVLYNCDKEIKNREKEDSTNLQKIVEKIKERQNGK